MRISTNSLTNFVGALQSKPFALLWTGQVISQLGNFAFFTAIAWEVILLTNSAADTGIIVMSFSIPSLVFLLVGGVIADVLPRRLLLLWSDVGRGIVVLLVSGLMWLHLLQFWHLIVLAVFFGVASCFFDPAYEAIRPQLVKGEQLASANALTALSRNMGALLGPLLGVGFVTIAGTVSAFAFNGVSFMLSALCTLLVRMPVEETNRERKKSEEKNDRPQTRHIQFIQKSTFEGLSYIVQSKWLWISILVASIYNIGSSSLATVLPKLVQDVYYSGIWLLGILTVSRALGAIFSTVTIGFLNHLHRRGIVAYVALIVGGAALIALGIPLLPLTGIGLPILASAIFGWALITFDIIWTTVMQELVPNEKLGRVTSVDTLVSFVFASPAYVLGGIMADAVGASWVFFGGGLLSMLAAVIALCVYDIRRLK